MGRPWFAAAMLLPLVGACDARLGDGPADAARDIDGHMNVNIDAPDGTTPLGPWSTPAKIPGGDSALDEDDCTLSSNELELYFKRNDSGDNNLYVMTRTSVTSAWSAPATMTILNSTGVSEESPRLSPDNLTLYFGRNGDIYKTTRTSMTQPWTAPSPVDALNTANITEKWADVCGTDYVIVSRANGTNGQDLYDGTISAGASTNMTQLNTTSAEQGTLLTADCLNLYFQSNRNNAQFDIYLATRTTTTAQWSNPTALTDFNTATYSEEDPWISPSGRTFVFASNASGNKDIYISTR